MVTAKNLGTLLISIHNATATVFGDNACVTSIIPSQTYDDDGVILDVTVSILKYKYDEEDYQLLLEIFDNLIYNPLFNSDYTLSKVNIQIKEF